MLHKPSCVIAAALFVLPTIALAAEPSSVRACPPSNTWTTGPDEEAGFMRAEGALAPIPAAGPFQVPWSFARLPDGSFLVTERPGHLQHARLNADTVASLAAPVRRQRPRPPRSRCRHGESRWKRSIPAGPRGAHM